MIYGTPLLVETNRKFKDYIKSLGKAARKNYKYVQKHNADLTYKETMFHKPDMERFMQLWSEQLIHGNEPVRWAFGVGHVEELNDKGVLCVFQASLDGKVIAMHFVEKYGEYVEAHPPMYDKKNNNRYLAKFMWFNLLRWCCNNDTRFLDLGSGNRGTWRELLNNRRQYKRIRYKWMYVPEEVKNNPNDQIAYVNYHIRDLKGICPADSRITKLVQGS